MLRQGCVVIFLSNFLALLIKVEAAEDKRRDALGALLVALNLFLVAAVIVTSWFATQQSVDDSRADDNTFAVTKAMITAERLSAGKARTHNAELRERPMVPPSSVQSNTSQRLPPIENLKSARSSGSVATGARSSDGSDVTQKGIGSRFRDRGNNRVAQTLWELDKAGP